MVEIENYFFNLSSRSLKKKKKKVTINGNAIGLKVG